MNKHKKWTFIYCFMLMGTYNITSLHAMNISSSSSDEKDEQTNNLLLNIANSMPTIDQTCSIYSHGLGEQGNSSTGPVYDYSGQKIKNSSFYGQTNINIFINYLLQNEQAKSSQTITIEGMSMGASVVLTALGELCKAADNTSHCLGDITEQAAKKIIEKINQGYIILDVPIFSMQHTQVMVFASRLSGLITASAIGICAYFLLKKYNQKNIYFNIMLSFGCALLLYNRLIQFYVHLYDKKIIPWLISENYNPNLDTPLQAAQIIRQYITCPILIHISKNDELLSHAKNDIAQLWNALVQNPLNNNTNNLTYLLLSGDGTHDQNNNDFGHIKQEFIKNPQSYMPCKTISQGTNLHKNSNLYDWTLESQSIDIDYKEPLFPLISSGITVAKTIGHLWG